MSTLPTSQTTMMSLSAGSQLPQLESTLSNLWQEALRQYQQTVRLSKQQEKLLQQAYSPEDFLCLTKEGWDETIIRRRSRYYETIRTATLDVLGVLDNVSPILGLAGVVFSHSFCCFVPG